MIDSAAANSGCFPNWEAASARLEELRRRDLAHVDVAADMEAIEDAFQAALRQIPPSTTSGLVTQQALFQKRRR